MKIIESGNTSTEVGEKLIADIREKLKRVKCSKCKQVVELELPEDSHLLRYSLNSWGDLKIIYKCDNCSEKIKIPLEDLDWQMAKWDDRDVLNYAFDTLKIKRKLLEVIGIEFWFE